MSLNLSSQRLWQIAIGELRAIGFVVSYVELSSLFLTFRFSTSSSSS